MINKVRKLIVIADIDNLKIFEAIGFKITQIIEETTFTDLMQTPDQRHIHQAHFARSLSTGHDSDLQGDAKEISREENAKFLSHYLEKLLEKENDFKEIIITAESKFLGSLRRYLSKNLKSMINKEIAKDFINQDIAKIEEAVFS